MIVIKNSAMKKSIHVTAERVNEYIDLLGYLGALTHTEKLVKAGTHTFPKTGAFIDIDTDNDTAVYTVSGGSGASSDSKEIASTRAKLKAIIHEDTNGTGVQKDINGVERLWQVTCYTKDSRDKNQKSVKVNESE